MSREYAIEIDPTKPLKEVGTRGFDRQEAYAFSSCAVDLRISQVVNVPTTS